MRTRLAAIAIAASLLAPAAHAADTATLTVKVGNVTDRGGNLRIGVYDKAKFLVRGSKPVMGEIVPAKAGEMTIVFSGLAPGEYGVKCFQDENANGKLDMGLMGMVPQEPYGLSNDAKPTMGGPPWDDAKFTLRPGAATIRISLH